MGPQFFVAVLEIPRASKIYLTLKNQRLTLSLPLCQVFLMQFHPFFDLYFQVIFFFYASKDLNLFFGFFLPRKNVLRGTVHFGRGASRNLSRKRSLPHYLYKTLMCRYGNLGTNLISTDITSKHSLADSSEQICSVK